MNYFSSGVSFGFSMGDILASAGGLLTSVGPYVAVGLAFILAPWFIRLIKDAFTKSRRA